MRGVVALAFVVVVAAALSGASARAATTTYDSRGTIYVDGVKTFPIALLRPPPLGGTTAWGTDALTEVAGAGVNLFAAGPFGVDWTDAALAEARAWNEAAATRGVHTWVNLRELARAQPGTPEEARLLTVVTTLKDDAGLALWKGADEPWWNRWPVSLLQHAYALTKSIDPNRLALVIQAPRGTAADLRPYSSVAGIHSVDIYPVTYGAPDPDLHAVGIWTRRIRSATPHRAVFTTLQVCFSGSDDPAGSGAYVVPRSKQQRYMVYDAIMNGARGLIFFGGHSRWCLQAGDAPLGWNWTYWNQVLKALVREVGPRSRLYPALLNPGTGLGLRTSDWRTPVVSRQVGRNVWVIAARHGTGRTRVRISGLPRSIARGWVYGERRRIPVRAGAFTDTFSRWDVHVYRFWLR